MSADPMRFFHRAQLVQLEVQRVTHEADEAAAAGDLDRVKACRAEADVLYRSMLDIRREQLIEQIEPSKPARRRWWQFWKVGSGDES